MRGRRSASAMMTRVYSRCSLLASSASSSCALHAHHHGFLICARGCATARDSPRSGRSEFLTVDLQLLVSISVTSRTSGCLRQTGQPRPPVPEAAHVRRAAVPDLLALAKCIGLRVGHQFRHFGSSRKHTAGKWPISVLRDVSNSSSAD